jgi:hypothetical protein
MAIDRKIVRRIGEDEIDFFTLQQQAQRLGETTVPANEPVASD